MRNDYLELQRVIEEAGYFTSVMPLKQFGDRLVCASHKYPQDHDREGLYGNSFWIAKRGGSWFVAGWAPAIYRVPSGERVAELCARLLRREPCGAYGDFDEQIRVEFALIPVSNDEFDSA